MYLLNIFINVFNKLFIKICSASVIGHLSFIRELCNFSSFLFSFFFHVGLRPHVVTLWHFLAPNLSQDIN